MNEYLILFTHILSNIRFKVNSINNKLYDKYNKEEIHSLKLSNSD